jgi:hypothetical protein
MKIPLTDNDRALAKKHTRKGFKGRKKFNDPLRQSYYPNLSEIAVAKYYGVEWQPFDGVRGPDVYLVDGTGVQVKCVLSSDYYKKFVGYELTKWEWEQKRGCDRVAFVFVNDKEAEIVSILDYNTVLQKCMPMNKLMSGDSANLSADWTGIPKQTLKGLGIMEEYEVTNYNESV